MDCYNKKLIYLYLRMMLQELAAYNLTLPATKLTPSCHTRFINEYDFNHIPRKNTASPLLPLY